MKSFWQVWAIPTTLCICTIFGLLAALLGLGIWHWASWIALGLPIVVVGYFLKKLKDV